jgi:beta-lactamase superfamily II metal-dependent hydrolase
MKRRILPIMALCVFASLAPAFADGFEPSDKLEIHYINVGQGGCTLIIGPDGTRILYDFGNVSGNCHIIPYLENAIGLAPDDGFDYAIVSHRDRDHYVGYKALVAASNGQIHKVAERRPVRDENDRSVALYVTYKNVQYILDGDLGSGPEACTHHDTRQIDIQSHVARALIAQGLMKETFGVDVLHIAHHGSESSTSAAYYNLVKPEVGLISVGLKQGAPAKGFVSNRAGGGLCRPKARADGSLFVHRLHQL